jgi:uncharacterized SAM-binding protein YcdF (DUF218 family)
METDKAPPTNISESESRSTPLSSLPAKFFLWPWRLRLFRRRTIWCPTWASWFLVATILLTLPAAWLNYGESFLASTHRVPADVLVVEGWIGREGIRAAVAEFKHGGYQKIVSSGGLTSGLWEDQPASFAEMAAREMIRLHVPKEKIIVATADYTESHRTFESAIAVSRALRNANALPAAVNVFTLGPHARRSALVFAKVLGPETKVGVIGWLPPDYKTEPWWRSSERSRELLEETLGYLFEVLLNSGRRSNAPEADGLTSPSSP